MPFGSFQHNNITQLTMDIWKDQVFFHEKPYPAGYFATAAMDVPDEAQAKLATASLGLMELLDQWNSAEPSKGQSFYPQLTSAARSILDQLWSISPYSCMDRSQEEEVLTRTLSPDADLDISKFGSDERLFITSYLFRLSQIPFGIIHFNIAAWYLAEHYLSFLEKRNEDYFAMAIHSCFHSEEFNKHIEGLMGCIPFERFTALPTVNMTYVFGRNPNPKKKEMVFVNRLLFDNTVDFYTYDLFNGMSWGHAPSKCQNCGKYFLTTDAYAPKYCDGFAPQNPNRTCRQYGAEQNQKEKNKNHPAYRICYKISNTIRKQYDRGKISKELRDTALALAIEHRERALDDSAYAADGYERDMEQETIYAEARRRLEE